MTIQEITINKIERKIRLLRKKMINAADVKGLNHPHTIKRSQQLDSQLNSYQRIKSIV
ncbi:hypothetical protein GCM10011351_01870 [Paraliobacillus quinghaiensis]|uniref:Aspartyl-phosphate phosphatase Spo0E family protein n=1 Tax=Paraliobacillus quinghaiensis TaxID=470815 RepID=A0A917WPV7_9BACI|nr:aspartyl-phosphate phosphatase Spo0E family protein [Paraliobacillus quinghaiensis]GGM19644.1 hypothetical protein GCM10011351_01870 [Paraliobacillus quinghaiensis]